MGHRWNQFFFLFIGRKAIAWPANELSTISNNCVWLRLQIIFCSYVDKTTLFSFLRSRLRENGRSFRRPFKKWPNDKTIIELGYRKISWFVSVSQINYLPVNYFTSYRPEEQEAWSDRSSCSDVSCSDVASSSASSGSLIASSASVLLRYPEVTKVKIG